MKAGSCLRITLVTVLLLTLPSLNGYPQSQQNKSLHDLFDEYYEDRLKLFPLEATSQGDPRYNDLLPNDGTAEYRKEVNDFYLRYQHKLRSFSYEKLSADDKLAYDVLMGSLERYLGESKFHPEYMPMNQMYSLPLTMGRLGSGTGNQPFKTVKDYDDWLKRVSAFTIWVDTAIANFRKGIARGHVLPKPIVTRMIPQMESLGKNDVTESVFYGPIKNLPTTFPSAERSRLTKAYENAISNELVVAYDELANFLRNEYESKARTTSGINALPDGDSMYRYYVSYFTTTDQSPEEIYETGLNEVKRITAEMERIKKSIGFKGSINELFDYMKTEPKFMPFRTSEEVLQAYHDILKKIQPHISSYFSVTPKSPFEIRQVEAFRAAATPPQYNRPSPDGSRPGIFYVPILDPTKINVTGWAMESVFLHEAIPGHHFEISLQQENERLPKFLRFGMISAFSEGWGLYAESLGELLGCYTDPYQKLGALGMEIHRAIRLVTDVGLHTGKMNREEAIAYMLAHEALPEQVATMEIERYMAIPGQALSYKTGELKIKELRDKYQKQLGSRFSLKHFHDALLRRGAMPLDVLEKYMDQWASGE